ncbi:MAG: replication-relaxation family protein, partial [Candidatus Omnitrophica bacterium]|nr:replication-relaxation family protein [Candidatus Omnitrophota bacterium]
KIPWRVRMNGKRSPFKRAKNLMVLQERDKKILALCHDYHFLSLNQIRLLLDFGSQTRANTRLRKLFDNGYLSRRFLPVVQGRANILCFLGSKGVELISEKSGIDPLKIKQKRKQLLEIKNLSLPHYLLINEFRLAFFLASRNKPEIILKSWKTQKEIPLRLEEREFYPDAYFVYSYRNKFYSAFLEIDRSTETNKRFQGKVENYLKYGLDGYYRRQFGFQFFRVLVVCQTQARLRSLKKLIGQKTDKVFWLAVQGDISPEKILGKIWQRPANDSLFSFLED